MEDKTLRQLIRGILNEKGEIRPTKYASIKHVYAPSDVPARKLLIISPGVDNAYGWTSAADHHAKEADTRLSDDIAYVVANNAGTPISGVMKDIATNDTLSKIDHIEALGFSGGGNTLIKFMKSNPDAAKISKFYLADPYWGGDTSSATIPYADKVVLMYKPGNWSAKHSMTEKFKVMDKSVKSGGGSSISTSLGHVEILKDMLNKANS